MAIGRPDSQLNTIQWVVLYYQGTEKSYFNKKNVYDLYREKLFGIFFFSADYYSLGKSSSLN